MGYKGIGAVLIITGCTGFGFSMALRHRLEEQLLRQLIRALDYMACELQYHMTALPELCRQAGEECGSVLGSFFAKLSQALEDRCRTDVAACVYELLTEYENLPHRVRENLRFFGERIGRFDLEGQKAGLSEVRDSCRNCLENLTRDRDTRLRSYQTLGLCTGAALAVLLV